VADRGDFSEAAARAELAERLSALGNAPAGLVDLLARDDEIAIARPLRFLADRRSA